MLVSVGYKEEEEVNTGILVRRTISPDNNIISVEKTRRKDETPNQTNSNM